MEVIINRKETDRTRVTITCRTLDYSVRRLKRYIEGYDQNIRGKCGDELVFTRMSDILYIESVDNRTFLYTADGVAELEHKLYELADILDEQDFIRCSRSLIVNVNQILKLRPEINRTIMATMRNGEVVHISRKYAKELKKQIGL